MQEGRASWSPTSCAPGSQHCEIGAVEFLECCVGILKAAGHSPLELLVRVDSGHDASDFLRKLEELGVACLVKHNLRMESPEQLLDSIRSFGTPEHPRKGKSVFRGVRADRKPAGYTEDEAFGGCLVVEGVERTIEANGQRLLIPRVEVDSRWTNLPLDVRQCVELYHDHGTSEQFHSKLKSDMGLELLPSGCLGTNSLVLVIGVPIGTKPLIIKIAVHRVYCDKCRKLNVEEIPFLSHPKRRITG